MTAGNTMTEQAQIPLDHSSSIKTILHVSKMFWLLSIISGSALYLFRKGGFAVGLTFPLSDLTDIVETMPRGESISSSTMRKAAWVSAMNKQLSERDVEQRFSAWYSWNEEGMHICTVSTGLPLSSTVPLRGNGDHRKNIMLYFIPPKTLL